MFTHLHVHSEYSLLDGISRIHEMVHRAKELGMGSLAITDHGSLYGVVDFYQSAMEAGVKPILGCEIYEAKESRHIKDPSEKSPYHLTVLAMDNRGYKNLMQLVTKAHLEGFYYRPRIDDEVFAQHSEGLIVLSGCPNAQIPRFITEGRMDKAAARAKWCNEVFPGRFFLEMQEHSGIPELPAINKGLLELSKSLGIPLVATNDSHYTVKGHAHLQDIRICISTNDTIHNPKRLKMEDESFYIKSPQEMAELFKDLPEAITNTQRIAEMCNTKLVFGELHLPRYPVPEGFTADQFLEKLCWEGLKRLYGNPTEEQKSRLRYELDVIRQTRFANYFLVVWEIVSFTRQNRILLGVRGSAAASLALYCMGVTEADPLKYGLVFERFLNIERKEMPDIDMDFQDDRRDEVLNYVMQRYGKDRVAQIITFGTLGPKAAIRDVGRARGLGYADTDRIARLVPFKVRTLRDALEGVPEMKDMYNGDPEIKNLLDDAQGLEGIPHHVSTHAAGVVISDEPLTEYIPLQQPVRGEAGQVSMTQFAMEPIAKLGLLKMDFLGLTNLTILDRTVKMLQKTRGLSLDLQKIPLDDKKTFDLLSSGHTNEVFQLESAGMQRNIKELKPTAINDVAAMIALYRPGPMEQIPRFIDAKHGRIPVRSPHPSLDEILKDSYGIIVFQDQVLKILQTFADYSLGSADIVRKAMGKKIPELMRKERERFLEGAVKKGFSKGLSEEVFSLIEPFAGYAFNKAHSVSYALISYWTGYFKANYRFEYMASVLNARRDQPEKMNNAINECLRMGIPILPPDVNRSDVEFALDKDVDGKESIRYGLSAIKNLGESAVTPIVKAREEGGPFKSLEDFARRSDPRGLNKRGLESLIKAGALDCLGKRGAVLNVMETILAQSQREARMRQTGQTSLFQGVAATDDVAMVVVRPTGEDALMEEKVAWEKELLGIPISSNPLKALAKGIPSKAIASRDQLDVEMEGQQVTVLGQLSSTQQRMTKDQRPFLSATLELLGGELEVLAWPQALERTRGVWQEGRLLLCTGKVVVRGEDISIYCDDAREYTGQESESSIDDASSAIESKRNGPRQNGNGSRTNGNKTNGVKTNGAHKETPTPLAPTNTILITLDESENQGEDAYLLQDLLQALLEYPGNDHVHLRIRTGGRVVRVDMPISVGHCAELEQRLETLLGPGKLAVEAAEANSGNGAAKTGAM
ncbi:MAG: DNA polymerase III subunit alpha [SAR202 cluster bacterium]|nr:DNA polymerase III subunit alpha [SAR202 cluster bacterium]